MDRRDLDSLVQLAQHASERIQISVDYVLLMLLAPPATFGPVLLRGIPAAENPVRGVTLLHVAPSERKPVRVGAPLWSVACVDAGREPAQLGPLS